MKKVLILVGVCVALFAILFITLTLTGVSEPYKAEITSSPYQFVIDGQKVTTTYFGNELTHDFNGDGRPDRAYIVTYSPGGSGTFYYVVVTLNTPQGPVNSEAYLLGDRIAPQTTEIGGINNNILIVNYADRKPTESFATPPSVGKTVQLILDPNTLRFGIVANNFEGESNR